MIVVDSSAIVAVLENEPLGDMIYTRLASARERGMSAVNYVEAGTVLGGKRRSAPEAVVERLDAFLSLARIDVLPLDATLAREALLARLRFGRGFGGPLNFGDSFAYALAKQRSAPLLFIGDDFSRTDIRSALA